MNYGAEPADQVVRYSLEGMEYSLKITGNVAKHVAIFIARPWLSLMPFALRSSSTATNVCSPRRARGKPQ